MRLFRDYGSPRGENEGIFEYYAEGCSRDGQDFVRIRGFSYFADAVGKLIIEQMKRYSV